MTATPANLKGEITMKLYELTTERMNELDAMITAFSAEGCREVYEYVGQNALKVFNLKEVCDNAYVMSFDDEDGKNLFIHVNFPELIYVGYALKRKLAHLDGRKKDYDRANKEIFGFGYIFKHRSYLPFVLFPSRPFSSDELNH